MDFTVSDTSAEATSIFEDGATSMLVAMTVIGVLVMLGTIEILFRCDETKP